VSGLNGAFRFSGRRYFLPLKLRRTESICNKKLETSPEMLIINSCLAELRHDGSDEKQTEIEERTRLGGFLHFWTSVSPYSSRHGEPLSSVLTALSDGFFTSAY
jgi:hypothetical protein